MSIKSTQSTSHACSSQTPLGPNVTGFLFLDLALKIKCNKCTCFGQTIFFLPFLAECRNYTFIVPVVRLLLVKYNHTLPLTIYMPAFSAVDRAQLQAQEDFLQLMESEEFKAMMKQQIYPGMKQYENTL